MKYTVDENKAIVKSVLEKYLFFAEFEEDDFKNMTTDEKLIVETYKRQMSTVLSRVMHKCGVMFKYCSWQGIEVKCTDLFKMRPTDNGYCCSFNALKQADQL